jgi:hypothetical protein
MKTPDEKIKDQILEKASSKRTAIILEGENGRQKAVFAWIGRQTVGRFTVHFETLKKTKVSGEICWMVEFWKVTRNNKCVTNGYDLISDEAAKVWIEEHKEGVK